MAETAALMVSMPSSRLNGIASPLGQRPYSRCEPQHLFINKIIVALDMSCRGWFWRRNQSFTFLSLASPSQVCICGKWVPISGRAAGEKKEDEEMKKNYSLHIAAFVAAFWDALVVIGCYLLGVRGQDLIVIGLLVYGIVFFATTILLSLCVVARR